MINMDEAIEKDEPNQINLDTDKAEEIETDLDTDKKKDDDIKLDTDKKKDDDIKLEQDEAALKKGTKVKKTEKSKTAKKGRKRKIQKKFKKISSIDTIKKNSIYIYIAAILSFIILLSILLGTGILDLFYDPTELFQECERLPSTVIPEHYILEIKVDVDESKLNFSGNVDIDIRCAENTNTVVLHSSELKLDVENIILREKNLNTLIKIQRISNENSFLTLNLRDTLTDGENYRLSIRFEGKLNKYGIGFFATPVYLPNNVKYYASTIFEPNNARKAFPCFDEPGFKATFDIRIVRKKNLISLSNMPKLMTEPRDGEWEADIFQKSLKMSTYLVAFFVGDAISKSKGNITVWEVNNKSALNEEVFNYILAISNDIIINLEKKLGVKHVAPKIDIVGIDGIRPSGMENWGLITIKQYYFNTQLSKNQASEDIYSVIVHEISHEWFGNLVTMKWWNDVWLNEGPTSYLEYLLKRETFPNKEVNDIIKIGEKNRLTDCYSSLILTAVPSNCNLMKIFEAYTYEKSLIIMRMLHFIIGNDNFWQGLKIYLEKFSFDSVEEIDFWNSFTSEALRRDKIKLDEVMSTWTHNGGVPIVTVKRNYFTRVAHLRQESCRAKLSRIYQDDIWKIPITYKTLTSKDTKNSTIDYWLTNKEKLIYNMPKMNEWILLNGENLGDYVVNYDRVNTKLLNKQLLDDDSVFTLDEKYKIFMDLTFLESLGYRNIKSLLDLYMYLPRENSEKILYFALKSPHIASIEYITNLMEADYFEYLWNEFMVYLLKPIFIRESLQFENFKKSSSSKLMYLNISENFCTTEMKLCIQETIRTYNLSKASRHNSIEKKIFYSTLLCINISLGKIQSIDNLHLRKIIAKDVDILRCSDDKNEIECVLESLFTEKNENEFVDKIKNIMINKKRWREFIYFLDIYFIKLTKDNRIFNYLLKSLYSIPQNLIKYSEIRKVLLNHIRELSYVKAEKLRLVIAYLNDDSKTKKRLKDIREWLNDKPWTKDF